MTAPPGVCVEVFEGVYCRFVAFRRFESARRGSKCTFATINAFAEINIMVTYEFESLILKKIKEGFRTTEELLKAIADYSSIKMKVVPFYLIGTTLRSYLSCLEHEGQIACEIIDNKSETRLV